MGWTQLIYALHAVSLLTGILTAATVVGTFLTGWPSIIAVILNYVKRSETKRYVARIAFSMADSDVLVWTALDWALSAFIVVTLGIGLIIAWPPMAIVGLSVHLPRCSRLVGTERQAADVT